MISIENRPEQFEELWDIYTEAFPRDERRSKSDIKRLIKKGQLFFEAIVRDEKIIGVTGYRVVDHVVYLEYLATTPEVRGSGAGSAFMNSFVNLFGNHPIVLEVEVPKDELQQRRISFYERIGFALNDKIFEQPPLQQGSNPVPLHLMTYGGKCSDQEWHGIEQLLLEQVYN